MPGMSRRLAADEPRGNLRKALALVSEQGLVSGTRSVTRKLLGRFYHKERALVLHKRLVPPVGVCGRASGPPSAGWTFREATEAETLVFARRVGFETKIASYLSRGDRCFMAFDDDNPIGMIWWVDGMEVARRGHAQVERFGIALGPEDVYSYDLYLLPSERGGGAATAYFAAFEADLARRGYANVFGWVDERNREARWLYALRRLEAERIVTSHVVLRRFRLTEGHAFVGPEHGYRRLRLQGPRAT